MESYSLGDGDVPIEKWNHVIGVVPFLFQQDEYKEWAEYCGFKGRWTTFRRRRPMGFQLWYIGFDLDIDAIIFKLKWADWIAD